MEDFINPYTLTNSSGGKKERVKRYDLHERSPFARKVYSSGKWRGPNGIRKRRLDADPCCVHCLEKGRTTLAQHVDHVVSIDKAPHLALEYGNTQSLCKRCHDRKTQAELKEKHERPHLPPTV